MGEIWELIKDLISKTRKWKDITSKLNALNDIYTNIPLSTIHSVKIIEQFIRIFKFNGVIQKG